MLNILVLLLTSLCIFLYYSCVFWCTISFFFSNSTTEEEKSEEISGDISDLKIISVVSLLEKPSEKPASQKPSVTISGTYVIKAERIKPGPRLIFEDSVSRIEKTIEISG